MWKDKESVVSENGKYMQPIIFYDFETTDANPLTCGIHQLSGAVMVKGKIVERFNKFIKPKEGCSVSPYAMWLAYKANGFGSVKAMRESDKYEPQDEVYKWFMDLLVRYGGEPLKDGHPLYQNRPMLGGFNIHKFDNEVLRQWMKDNGETRALGNFIADASVDLLLICGPILGRVIRNVNNMKLKEVAWTLGVKVEQDKLHSSDYDTEMCVEIYRTLVKQGYIRPLSNEDFFAIHSTEDLNAHNDEYWSAKNSVDPEEQEFIKNFKADE